MDAVQERKERLKALKEAAALVEMGDEQEDAKKTDIPELKFRNYAPKDQNIEHIKVISSGHITEGGWCLKERVQSRNRSGHRKIQYLVS